MIKLWDVFFPYRKPGCGAFYIGHIGYSEHFWFRVVSMYENIHPNLAGFGGSFLDVKI